MIKYRALFLLLLASLFAVFHLLAVELELYWYIDWFDVFMHIWGGILIVYCLYVLKGMNLIRYNLTLGLVFGTISIIIVSWELFQWLLSFYGRETSLSESIKDIAIGLVSGLSTYLIINMYNGD
jgi:hypothetical protein